MGALIISIPCTASPLCSPPRFVLSRVCGGTPARGNEMEGYGNAARQFTADLQRRSQGAYIWWAEGEVGSSGHRSYRRWHSHVSPPAALFKCGVKPCVFYFLLKPWNRPHSFLLLSAPTDSASSLQSFTQGRVKKKNPASKRFSAAFFFLFFFFWQTRSFAKLAESAVLDT